MTYQVHIQIVICSLKLKHLKMFKIYARNPQIKDDNTNAIINHVKVTELTPLL